MGLARLWLGYLVMIGLCLHISALEYDVREELGRFLINNDPGSVRLEKKLGLRVQSSFLC